MATAETRIVHEIILHSGSKLFKNVSGLFYTHDGRPQRVGCGPNGASDLLGFTVVKITPEMIGREVAIFTAVEVKTETGRASEKQLDFIEAVKKNGGIACVARNIDDVKNTVDRWIKGL